MVQSEREQMGTRWENKLFYQSRCWKIERASSQGHDQNVSSSRPALEDIPPENDELSDLPF